MSEAIKLDGQFRFWKTDTRDRKLAGCVKILKQFARRAIYVVIDTEAFKTRWAPHLLRPMSSPYFMGCYSILSGVCFDVLDEFGASEKIEVIFDEQVIFAPRINAWYPIIKDSIEIKNPELRGILPLALMFKDDQEFVPLQASDVIAWLFRMAHSGERNEFEWIAEELSPAIPMSKYSSVFDADRMDRIHIKSLNIQFPRELVKKWRDSLGIDYLAKQKPKTRKKR